VATTWRGAQARAGRVPERQLARSDWSRGCGHPPRSGFLGPGEGETAPPGPDPPAGALPLVRLAGGRKADGRGWEGPPLRHRFGLDHSIGGSWPCGRPRIPRAQRIGSSDGHASIQILENDTWRLACFEHAPPACKRVTLCCSTWV